MIRVSVAAIEPLKMNAILSVVILSVILTVVKGQCGWEAPYGGCNAKVCTEIYFHLVWDLRLPFGQFLKLRRSLKRISIILFSSSLQCRSPSKIYPLNIRSECYLALCIGKHKRWNCYDFGYVRTNILFVLARSIRLLFLVISLTWLSMLSSLFDYAYSYLVGENQA